MRRVVVVGNGGSGKSWVATRLAGSLEAPLHRLDTAVFHDDWRRRDDGERHGIEGTWARGSAWVIDGTGLATLPARLARADTVVVMETPAWRCIWRVVRRRLRRRGPARPGVVGAERLRPRYVWYVATYGFRHAPRVSAALDGFAGTVVRLRGQSDVCAFLAARPSR